jgi:hypothetical protein
MHRERLSNYSTTCCIGMISGLSTQSSLFLKRRQHFLSCVSFLNLGRRVNGLTTRRVATPVLLGYLIPSDCSRELLPIQLISMKQSLSAYLAATLVSHSCSTTSEGKVATTRAHEHYNPNSFTPISRQVPILVISTAINIDKCNCCCQQFYLSEAQTIHCTEAATRAHEQQTTSAS